MPGKEQDGYTHMSIEPKAMAGDIPVYCSHDEIVDIMKVIPNPKNPNTHPDRQIEILSQVIKAQGWRKPITVSRRSGFVVSGHGRLQAALMLQLDKVPVDYQHYANEAEEYADLVADNRIAELSNIDEDLLIDILNEINDTDIDTILTGYEYHEIDELINDDESITVIDNMTEPNNDSKQGKTNLGDSEPHHDEMPQEQTQQIPQNPEPIRQEDDSEDEEPQITTTTNFHYKEQYGVIIICKDEHEQQEVYERLYSEGYECKVVTT